MNTTLVLRGPEGAMTSAAGNFAFLKAHDRQLPRLGKLAERYFQEDPNTCLMKLRQFGELLAAETAARYGLWISPEEGQSDLLRRLRDRSVLPREVLDLFHHLRKAGNDAAHDLADDHRTALGALKKARALGVWFHRSFSGDSEYRAGPFVPPATPEDESAARRLELEQLRSELVDSQTTSERAAALAEQETLERQSAEERAQQKERERTEWEELAREVENDNQRVVAELERLQSVAVASPAEQIELAIDRGIEAGQELDLDERETRKIVNVQLRAAGWEADTETLTYENGVRPQRGKNLAIAELKLGDDPPLQVPS